MSGFETSFYRGERMLPFTVTNNGIREYQTEVIRARGMESGAQFALCTEGIGSFTDENGKLHNISKNDVFYFLPDTPHSYKNLTEKWTVRYIVIDSMKITDLLGRFGFLRSGVLRLDENTASKLNSFLDSVFEKNSSQYDKMTKARLSADIYRMLLSLRPFLFGRNADQRSKAYNKLLPVFTAIDTRLSEDLPLDMLSGMINVTPTYLCRLFKDGVGVSPLTYITSKRLAAARDMLISHQNMSAAAIAAGCGFSDASYFGKLFKRNFGMTPEQYRCGATYKSYNGHRKDN